MPIKGQDEIYLASELADGYRLRSRSAEVSMQRSLRSLLSVDVADFTGLTSCRVKYYVKKLSVTLILLSMKLSGSLVMSHWKTGLRILSNNIYACLSARNNHWKFY